MDAGMDDGAEDGAVAGRTDEMEKRRKGGTERIGVEKKRGGRDG